MSPAWIAVAGVGLVALAVTVWRARLGEQARQAQHAAIVRDILAADPEITHLEACWRLPAYQPHR